MNKHGARDIARSDEFLPGHRGRVVPSRPFSNLRQQNDGLLRRSTDNPTPYSLMTNVHITGAYVFFLSRIVGPIRPGFFFKLFQFFLSTPLFCW